MILGKVQPLCRLATVTSRVVASCDAASSSYGGTVRTIRPGFQRRLRSTTSDDSQRIPLEGYYADILGSHQDYATTKKTPTATTTSTTSTATTTTTAASPASSPTTPTQTTTTAEPTPTSSKLPVSTDLKQEQQARAKILFGNRTFAPDRQRELDARSTVIAGVTVPPKPTEPDNCCMSGCVNCVWDSYRDELEEWAAKNAEAQGRLAMAARKKSKEPVAGAHVALSMDDDGGGSETNWDLSELGQKKEEDLFKGIPVGIREFMRTEKALKERHTLAGGTRA